jgi:nitroreductase
MVSGEVLLDLIRRRQSERSYLDRPVEKEKLERILEAGRMAPSACNAQPWKFIVVDQPELLSDIAEAASAKLLGMNTFVALAPVLIVIVREKPNFSSRIGAGIKKKDYSLIDIGIASENICLQAKAEGLGTCILGWFDEEKVRNLLGVPRGKRIGLIITLGYPSKEYREKKRKSPDEIIAWNRY